MEDVELTYLGLEPSILKYVNLKIPRKCMSIDLNEGKTKIISSLLDGGCQFWEGITETIMENIHESSITSQLSERLSLVENGGI